MKYIRTKNGIVERNKVSLIIHDDKECYEEITDWEHLTCSIYHEVIKQADTIEELCDEFVLFRDGKPYAIVSNKGHNAELAKDVWKDYRGAIWTDKGLIYVAKMNEKRELELL